MSSIHFTLVDSLHNRSLAHKYLLQHVAQVLLGLGQLHSPDGVHDFTGVLEVHAQRGAAGLRTYG